MTGNKPNFTNIDVLRCFLRLDKNISRQELSRQLKLGEGTVRTILGLLKSKKLLQSTKKGHFLSKLGLLELSRLHDNVENPKIIAAKSIYPEYHNMGVLLKKSEALKQAYKLRDIAVKNHAEGALILKFQNKLFAPESGYKGNFTDIEKHFEFKNGNILIIAFAQDFKDAEVGALAIAAELNRQLGNFIKKFE